MLNPSFSPVFTGMWFWVAEFPLAAGARDPLVCPSGKGDSELQRFPKATGTEGLQKTPEEEKQQHLSILKLPETH